MSLSIASVCNFANQSSYIWGETQTGEGSALALSYGIDLVDYKRKGEKDSNPSSKLYSFKTPTEHTEPEMELFIQETKGLTML